MIPLWTTATKSEEWGCAFIWFGRPWVAHLTCPIPTFPFEGELNNILKKDVSQIDFTVKKKFSEQVITLSVGNHYKLLEFSKKDNASEDQLFLRNAWLSWYEKN